MRFGCLALLGILGSICLPTVGLADPYLRTDYFSLRPGTVWVFKSSRNQFERREVKALRQMDVPELGRKVTFAEVMVSRAMNEQALSMPTSARTLFYLPTTRGMLMSPSLGENAREFWSGSFLLFPEPLPKPETTWSAWVSGTACIFRFHGLTQVIVPMGRFEQCAKISYQSSTEGLGRGEIYFCPEIGEAKFIEEDVTLDLVRFQQAKKTGVEIQPLSPDETEKIWQLLPGETPIATRFADEDAPIRFRTTGNQMLFLLGLAILLSFVWLLYRYGRRIRTVDVPIDPLALDQAIERALQDLEAGNLVQAKKQLEDLIQTFPHYADLHFRLALVHERGGNLDLAISSLENAVRINPNYVSARLRLGELYETSGHFHEALRNLRAVLTLHPDYPDIHNRLGKIFEKQGKKDEARAHFEQALAINPHFVEARRNLQQL